MDKECIPQLSVIIPVFNVEKYIERCVRSLFSQTLNNIEFIFIDDCTPDHSIDILNSIIEEISPRFERQKWNVIIEKMPTNCGQAEVRRHGIQLSKGEYVIHCDSDDWIEPEMFSIMMDTARKSDADMVVCDFYRTDGEAVREIEQAAGNMNNHTYLIDLLYQKYSWALWNKMTKKKIYDKVSFYPKHSMGEDMVIVPQLVASSSIIKHVQKPQYNYYINPKSTMNVTGEDISERKYLQLKENTQVLIEFLRSCLDEKTLSSVKHSLNYNMVLPILPYIRIKKKKDIYNCEITSIIPYIISRKIFWRYRALAVLVKFGLYPIPLKWLNKWLSK